MEDQETISGLIDAIVADRYDLDRYRILADALEEHGDPLGDVVRLAIGLHDVSGYQAFNQGSRAHLAASLGEPSEEDPHQRLRQQVNAIVNQLLRKRVRMGIREGSILYTDHRGRQRVRLQPHRVETGVSWRQVQPLASVRELPYPVQRAIIVLLVEELDHSSQYVSGQSDFSARQAVHHLWNTLARLYQELVFQLDRGVISAPHVQSLVQMANRIADRLGPHLQNPIYISTIQTYYVNTRGLIHQMQRHDPGIAAQVADLYNRLGVPQW